MNDLNEIAIPLSENDWKEIRRLLKTGLLKWENLSKELKGAYNLYPDPLKEKFLKEFGRNA